MGNIVARYLGTGLDYHGVWQQMQTFTRERTADTQDELWLLEHRPVFTLGRNAKREHVLAAGDIPVIQVDRGGQVTYHGPGQLIVYLLLDIRRKGLGVRELVVRIEQAIIDLLAYYQVSGLGNREAPGVYIDDRKVAALGLRVSKGCTYHGLGLNVCMDTEPFQRINPCGYPGLQVTQCCDWGMPDDALELMGDLCAYLAKQLGYDQIEWQVS